MSGWNQHQKNLVARSVGDFEWQAAHEWLEDYDSFRPYPRPPRRDTHKSKNDCTGNIKLVLCDWNVIKPFDGTPRGYGNTATFANGPKVYHVGGGPSHWQPLDIILYKEHQGPFHAGPDEHATILLYEKNGVWMCSSHGSDSGPKILPYNYRHDYAMVIRFPIPLK